jgi:DNA-binding transcriptional LysR family regulator
MERVLFSRFLLYFDEIARSGSVRQAAARLNLSPSAVDKQLVQAEEALGISLFERRSKGLRLTSAGEILLYRLRGWQKDVASIQREINALQGLSRGELRIVAAQEAVGGFLPTALAAFMRDYPRISTSFSVMESERIARAVLEGQADFGLTFGPQPMPGVEVVGTRSLYMRAVLPAGDRLAAESSIALTQFFEQPVIVPDSSIHLRDVIDIAAARARIRLVPILTTNSSALMYRMVAEGVGYGIEVFHIGDKAQLGEGLVSRPFKRGAIPAMTLSLVVATGRQSSVAAIVARRALATYFTA